MQHLTQLAYPYAVFLLYPFCRWGNQVVTCLSPHKWWVTEQECKLKSI